MIDKHWNIIALILSILIGFAAAINGIMTTILIYQQLSTPTGAGWWFVIFLEIIATYLAVHLAIGLWGLRKDSE